MHLPRMHASGARAGDGAAAA
eukprot:COSAG02_NODE_57631_length_280_cov_0.569061_1_plen_20_part_01